VATSVDTFGFTRRVERRLCLSEQMAGIASHARLYAQFGRANQARLHLDAQLGLVIRIRPCLDAKSVPGAHARSQHDAPSAPSVYARPQHDAQLLLGNRACPGLDAHVAWQRLRRFPPGGLLVLSSRDLCGR
jgi:hypothetical protein